MTMPKIICLCLFFAISIRLFAANGSVQSPDKAITVTVKSTSNAISYQVKYRGELLVNNSPLGLSFKDGGAFGHNLSTGKATTRTIIDDYNLTTGKASHVHSVCNEMIVPVTQMAGNKRKLNIEVRVFNDGVAIRYCLPAQQSSSVSITDENTTFNLAGNPVALTLFRENYTTSHEGIYDKLHLSQIKADTLMDLPALFEFPKGIYMSITEANLHDWAGMYLVKHNGVLTSNLSPLPKQKDVKVIAKLPHYSPWRVMMISNRVGALMESNMITSLNEPNKIKDVSWIKYGKTTFPWWNGNVMPDTTWEGGNNFETNMYYVNFCAQNNVLYHSVVEYGQHEWYVNDGPGFNPGPHADPSKSVALLDMQRLCDSAKAKGVGIRVWVHFYALYPKLEETFAQYEKWGIAGLMCDFMDRDDQEMVNMQEEILQRAAAHHLHIQFHGAYKPTGENRTYPNMFTREGTLNYENDKWGNRVTPDADINIPFTRGLAGSTDYHLGGFRAANTNNFKMRYTAPYVMGTRCHMLAMYVVLENEQGMMCDNPAAYLGQPGFEFLKAVPLTWDETRIVDAKLSNYVTTARRKGNDWYLGTITNNTGRNINTSLSFLPAGDYTAEIYSDAADDSVDPNHLTKTTVKVNNKTILPTALAAGGGQVMRIYKN